MVNSLKHALELPRSSAMNNQDKCDPDWVGWHVFYGVLIPLYIVVGFSCSKTKHRTSLSVSTGQGCREQYTFHRGSFFKALCKAGWELMRGASLGPTPFVALCSVPARGHHPLGSSPCPWASCWTRLHKHRQVPSCSWVGSSPTWVQTFEPSKESPPSLWAVSELLKQWQGRHCPNPCSAKAARSHDQHSSAEKLVELCSWTAAEDYWLIASICGSRRALEHLNATCISSLLHGGGGLFQYYLKLLFICILTE